MNTIDGEKIIKMPDGGNLSEDEGWFKPSANPFLHGCCECGLAHQVQVGYVVGDSVILVNPEKSQFVLRFTRDDQETRNIREQRRQSGE